MERLEEFKEWEEPEDQEEPEELDALTMEVCKEYRKKARDIGDETNPLQIGRRKN